MSNSTDPLAGAWLKIERAKQHVNDLKLRIDAFSERKPYQFVAKPDFRASEYVWRVYVKEEAPTIFGAIVGDVVHNLRSALDHLACQLVIANGNQPRRNTGFPIGGSRKKFESDLIGKVQGASLRAIRLIHRLKPYKGGNEAFWRIHELDVLDKHKTIIVVGAAHKRIKITSGSRGEISIAAPTLVYPLQEGAVVHRLPFDAYRPDLNDQIKCIYVVAFGEKGIIEGESVLPALSDLVALTEKTIFLFEKIVL